MLRRHPLGGIVVPMIQRLLRHGDVFHCLLYPLALPGFHVTVNRMWVAVNLVYFCPVEQ